ncbi:MAG: CerR family C-terminal domain-containing protein [Thermodesulfobacteriota bacterium]|nr:CerR family C-terminal domain-containing protein [Thermodesulfobacteriota bacterium]
MNKIAERSLDTRSRLLQAAGEVFASHGFRAATVREISRRADANIAAVNYHFGNKKRLYSAVLHHTLRSAIEKYPPDFGLDENSTPEQRLHAFIRSLLFRLLDKGRPAWHGRLMAREIAEPTSALDQLVVEVMRPLYERLTSIVRDLTGKHADEESVKLCVMSVMGQCLFYHHARSVVLRLYPQEFGPAEIERLADHICRFSVQATRGFQE